jgi:hypothetical protein
MVIDMVHLRGWLPTSFGNFMDFLWQRLVILYLRVTFLLHVYNFHLKIKHFELFHTVYVICFRKIKGHYNVSASPNLILL